MLWIIVISICICILIIIRLVDNKNVNDKERTKEINKTKYTLFDDDYDDAFYHGTGFSGLTFCKKALIEKNGPYCEMCGQTNIPLQVDHIIPVSRGGNNEIENMQLLCYECHLKKHNYKFEEIGHSNRKIPKKYELLNWAYKNEKKVEIRYKKYDGTITKRIIRPITSIYYEKYGEKGGYYIIAFCYLREKNRIFKLSRILSVKKQ